MSFERTLAKIRSIGEQLDFLALKTLSDQTLQNYMMAKNLSEISLQRESTANLLQKEPKTPIAVDDTVYDDSETQVIKRSATPIDNKIQTIQSITDQLDISPSSAKLWIERGILWQEEGNYASALSDFLRAYQIDNEDSTTLQYLVGLQKICGTQGKTIDLSEIIKMN